MGFLSGDDEVEVTTTASKAMDARIDLAQSALSQAAVQKAKNNTDLLGYIHYINSCGGSLLQAYKNRGYNGEVTDKNGNKSYPFRTKQYVTIPTGITEEQATAQLATLLGVDSSRLSNVVVTSTVTYEDACIEYLVQMYNYSFNTRTCIIDGSTYSYKKYVTTYTAVTQSGNEKDGYTYTSATYTSYPYGNFYKVYLSKLEVVVVNTTNSSNTKTYTIYTSAYGEDNIFKGYYKISYKLDNVDSFKITNTITTSSGTPAITTDYTYPALALRSNFTSVDQYDATVVYADNENGWVTTPYYMSKDRYYETEYLLKALGFDIDEVMNGINNKENDNDAINSYDLRQFKDCFLVLGPVLYKGPRVEQWITEQWEGSDNSTQVLYYSNVLVLDDEIFENYFANESDYKNSASYQAIKTLFNTGSKYNDTCAILGDTISETAYNTAGTTFTGETTYQYDTESHSKGEITEEYREYSRNLATASEFNRIYNLYSTAVNNYYYDILKNNFYFNAIAKYFYELIMYYIDKYGMRTTNAGSSITVQNVEDTTTTGFYSGWVMDQIVVDPIITQTYVSKARYSYKINVNYGVPGTKSTNVLEFTKELGYNKTTIYIGSMTFGMAAYDADATGHNSDGIVDRLSILVEKGVQQLSPIEKVALFRESVYFIQRGQQYTEGEWYEGALFTIVRIVLEIVLIVCTLGGATPVIAGVETTITYAMAVAIALISVAAGEVIGRIAAEIDDPILGTLVAAVTVAITLGTNWGSLLEASFRSIITLVEIPLQLGSAFINSSVKQSINDLQSKYEQIQQEYEDRTEDWYEVTDPLTASFLVDISKDVANQIVSPILMSVNSFFNLCFKVFDYDDIYGDSIYYTNYDKLLNVGFY